MACVDTTLLNEGYCGYMSANTTGAPDGILRYVGAVNDWHSMLDAGGPLDAPVP